MTRAEEAKRMIQEVIDSRLELQRIQSIYNIRIEENNTWSMMHSTDRRPGVLEYNTEDVLTARSANLADHVSHVMHMAQQICDIHARQRCGCSLCRNVTP